MLATTDRVAPPTPPHVGPLITSVVSYPFYDVGVLLTAPPYPFSYTFPPAPRPDLYSLPSPTYWPSIYSSPLISPTPPITHIPPPLPLTPVQTTPASTTPIPALPPVVPPPPPPAIEAPMVHQQGYPPGPPPDDVPPPVPTQTTPPDEQFLWNVFQRVNRDKSGYVSASELQSALSNGTWKPFNPATVRMMIEMFGKECRGSVSLREFGALWCYVTEWLNCFQSFDRDTSGFIDMHELREALTAFGYQLTEKLYLFLIHKFDREGKGAINFDDFIQCCVVLQALTASFRAQDTDGDGWVRMTYEQFLLAVFRLSL